MYPADEIKRVARKSRFELRSEVDVLLSRLECVAWFSRIGHVTMNETKDYDVVVAKSLRDAKRSCFSKRWDNTLTDARNHLSGVLFQIPGPDNPLQSGWNETVRDVTGRVEPIVTKAVVSGRDALLLSKRECAVLDMTVRRQIVHACHEIQFAQFTPPRLFVGAIAIYEAGHWVCGWEGEWPEGRLIIW